MAIQIGFIISAERSNSSLDRPVLPQSQPIRYRGLTQVARPAHVVGGQQPTRPVHGRNSRNFWLHQPLVLRAIGLFFFYKRLTLTGRPSHLLFEGHEDSARSMRHGRHVLVVPLVPLLRQLLQLLFGEDLCFALPLLILFVGFLVVLFGFFLLGFCFFPKRTKEYSMKPDVQIIQSYKTLIFHGTRG